MNPRTSRSLRRHLPAVLLASTIVGGCARTAETAADRRAEEIAIAMQIGAPLPDAIDTRTFWSAASHVPYSHRLDIDAIDQWYADLPNRFECQPAETTPRSAGRERQPRWSLRCLVDEGAWWLVIAADTTPGANEAVTVVGAHHELKLAPTPTT